MGPGQGEKKNPSGQSLCCTNVWDWRQGKFVQPGLRDLIPSRQIKLEKLRLNPTFLPHRGQMIREMGSQLRALHPPGFQRGKPGTGHSGSSFPTARGWSGTWQRLQDSLPQPSPCSTRGGVFLGLRGWSGQIQGIRAARSLQGTGSEQRDPNQGRFHNFLRDWARSKTFPRPCGIQSQDSPVPHEFPTPGAVFHLFPKPSLCSRAGFPLLHSKPPQNSQFMAQTSPGFSSLCPAGAGFDPSSGSRGKQSHPAVPPCWIRPLPAG